MPLGFNTQGCACLSQPSLPQSTTLRPLATLSFLSVDWDRGIKFPNLRGGGLASQRTRNQKTNPCVFKSKVQITAFVARRKSPENRGMKSQLFKQKSLRFLLVKSTVLTLVPGQRCCNLWGSNVQICDGQLLGVVGKALPLPHLETRP